MHKHLILSDIDNTLIVSRKHPHEGWPCVERIHGEEQAYMSPEAIRNLQHVPYIAVTSRSIAQYSRICFPEGCSPVCAVTANGADLIIDGVPDAAWHAETQCRITDDQAELARMFEALAGSERYIRCRMVDDAYLFVYCAADVDPQAEAARIAAKTDVTVIASGKKIYLMPHDLSKGVAVQRLLHRFGAEGWIAAGDSEMDLPMLAGACKAIVPQPLASSLPADTEALVCPNAERFTEFAPRMFRECNGGSV